MYQATSPAAGFVKSIRYPTMRFIISIVLVLSSLTFRSIHAGPVQDSAVKAPASPRQGRPAPEITGKDLSGVEFNLSDYRGKVILLEFWGAWCVTCWREFPKLRELDERYDNEGFVMLGVASGPLDNNKAAVASEDLPWRSWWDGGTSDGPIAEAWRVNSWPTRYLIDADGIVRGHKLESDELEQAIEKALGPDR